MEKRIVIYILIECMSAWAGIVHNVYNAMHVCTTQCAVYRCILCYVYHCTVQKIVCLTVLYG